MSSSSLWSTPITSSYVAPSDPIAQRSGREAVIAGLKAAGVATIASAVPTLACARMLPWGRAYLKPPAQALIISYAAGAAFFVVSDKTVVALAREHSMLRAAAHQETSSFKG